MANEQVKNFGRASHYYQEVIKHEVSAENDGTDAVQESGTSLFELSKEGLMRSYNFV